MSRVSSLYLQYIQVRQEFDRDENKWVQPTLDDSVLFMMSELGEVADAFVRAKGKAYARNRDLPNGETANDLLHKEMADLVVMCLAVLHCITPDKMLLATGNNQPHQLDLTADPVLFMNRLTEYALKVSQYSRSDYLNTLKKTALLRDNINRIIAMCLHMGLTQEHIDQMYERKRSRFGKVEFIGKSDG